MIDYRCKTCTWWDKQHEAVLLIPKIAGKGMPGICRKHKPGAVQVSGYYYGVQPVMDAEEFCGEYKGE